MHSSSSRFHRGFTLLEVMTVVVIIGILASLAYPSYVEHVRRGKRAEAQAALLEAAQFMQRFYAANNRYDVDMQGNPTPAEPPHSNAQLPYTVRLTANPAVTRTSFTLEAVPTAGDPKCGTLTLNHLGEKGILNQQAGVTARDCWR